MTDLHPLRGVRRTLTAFLASIALLGAVQLYAFLQREHLKADQERALDERRAEDRAIAQRAFTERISSLDRTILEYVASAGPEVTVSGSRFDALADLNRRTGATFELADSSGIPRAWAGRSVRRGMGASVPADTSGPFIRITQNGVFTNLTVGRWLRGGGHSLLASVPLDNDLPVLSRFLSQSTLASRLAEQTPGFIEIDGRSSFPDSGAKDQFRVPLLGPDGSRLASAVFAMPTVEGLLQEQEEAAHWWTRSFGAAAVLAAGVALGLLLRHRRRPIEQVGGRILLIWIVRFALLGMGVPSMMGASILNDSTVYGSLFGGGLAASPAELLLSASALLLSVLLLIEWLRSSDRASGGTIPISLRRRILLGTGAALLAFVFVLFVRGFAACIRSFILDSTNAYQDATTVIPDARVLLMFAAIVLLSLGFLGIFVLLIERIIRWVREAFVTSARSTFIVMSLAVCVAVLALRMTEETSLWPWWVPVFAAIVVGGLIRWEQRVERLSLRHGPRSWRVTSAWLLVAFAVASPIVGEQIVERDHLQAEAMAAEFLRPVDSWLAVVLTDGLRTASTSLSQRAEVVTAGDSTEGLAFDLWSQTEVSRQDNNSGLVVFDAAGKEVDRFVVGIGSYEQAQILKQVFDHEEETVQAIDRPEGRGSGKLYGIWSTVRNLSGGIAGNLVVIIEGNASSLGDLRESDPLRRPLHGIELRHVYVTDIRDSVVAASSRPDLYGGSGVPAVWDASIANPAEHGGWVDDESQGESLESYLVRDPQTPGRWVALSISGVDIRWQTFTLLRLSIAFLLGAVVVTIFHLAGLLRRRERITITFGQRLFVAFAVSSVVPLVILGYYNREVSRARVEAGVEKSLQRDLGVVERRIALSVSDAEDFSRGVTDEYCRAVGAEYDIDFAVYRGMSVQASTRPELYRAALFDRRLDGLAFRDAVIEGRGFSVGTQAIGHVPYIVGYTPLTIGGERVGVVAISTIYRQRDIDEEVADRNVGVFGIYAAVLVAALAAGGLLAARIAGPIRELSSAAGEVGRGRFDVELPYAGSDEIGELTGAFRNMAAELARSRSELAAAERERAWREMAKQVAHEIRNPLTPIKLSVQHLRQAFRDGAADREQLLQRVTETVLDQIDVLSRIATEFSHFARMPDARYERAHLGRLLDEAVAIFAEVDGIRFERSTGELPVTLLADREQLRRVFINMFRNSIQAMPGGGTILLETSVEERTVVLRVTDNGPGIPPEVLSRVFEPNFSTKSEGMGLGLAIAKKVIEDHGGTIRCESAVGHGTSFEIRLPSVA